MNRFVVGIVASAVLLSFARRAIGQSKSIRSKMKVETATVEAIDHASRTITLRKRDNTFVTFVAGSGMKRLAKIKVGDEINARYYERPLSRLHAAARSTQVRPD